MKILQTVFDLNDYGGIVNYVEILQTAFQKLGHTCATVVLRDSTRDPYLIKATTPTVGNYKSRVAARAHVTQGWYGIQVFNYGNYRQRDIWRNFANGFDLIIHQVPNPKLDTRGAWRKLYQVEPPQIIATHDAHFQKLYPYLIDIADQIVGITAAQEAGYNALAAFPAWRAFMGCPTELKSWSTQAGWADRHKQFVSAHVWKAWKRMHLVVQAIPYIGAGNFIAGDGIEGRYMRSETKCPPKYRGLWAKAISHGMEYHGFISPTQLANAYQGSRAMVDLSWSKHHADLGNHFNYSTLEAINNGCIPICVRESMEEYHKLKMFTEDETHFAVGADDTPKEIAKKIDHVVRLHPRVAREIQHNGQEMLHKYCDALECAKWFIRMGNESKGKIGIYRRPEMGKATDAIREARNKAYDKAYDKAGAPR
jgi:hypothetical protein